jgi:hypothetical protein
MARQDRADYVNHELKDRAELIFRPQDGIDKGDVVARFRRYDIRVSSFIGDFQRQQCRDGRNTIASGNKGSLLFNLVCVVCTKRITRGSRMCALLSCILARYREQRVS